MTAPITSSTYQMDLSALFRDRWAGRTVNAGEVRDVGGFQIDVAGQAARGQETYRSNVTAGRATRLYDPESPPPHASSALSGGLPTSSLLVLQGDSAGTFKAPAQTDTQLTLPPDQNPYAVSLPAWVDIQHTEDSRPSQITSVSYFGEGVGPGADSQKAFTLNQVDRLKALAKIERDLSAEYGEPVKLAWDGVAGEYMMLREGQLGYNDVLGANDLLRRLPKDLKELHLFSMDEIDRMTA